MIRFSCPNCTQSIEAGPDLYGTKTSCSRCGQRLLVPIPPPISRTVLGKLESAEPAPLAHADAAPTPALSPDPPAAIPIEHLVPVFAPPPRIEPPPLPDLDRLPPRSPRRIGLAIMALAVALLGLGSYAAVRFAKSIDNAAPPGQPPPFAPPPAAGHPPSDGHTDWLEPAMLGPMKIQIRSANIGPAELFDTIHRTKERSRDNLLVVHVSLWNVSDTKKVSYSSWNLSGRIYSNHAATLTDDLGNRYKHINFGFGIEPVGWTKADSAYPHEGVSDVLIFEQPVERASFLTLHLPGSAIDAPGEIRFRIPADKVR